MVPSHMSPLLPCSSGCCWCFLQKSPTFLCSLFMFSLDLFVFFSSTSTPSPDLSLLVVPQIKCRWCFFSPLLLFPFKVSTPFMMLEPYADSGVLQMVLPPTSWEMVIFGEFRLTRLPLPLVPTSLGGPLYGWRQWNGVTTSGGADAQ